MKDLLDSFVQVPINFKYFSNSIRLLASLNLVDDLKIKTINKLWNTKDQSCKKNYIKTIGFDYVIFYNSGNQIKYSTIYFCKKNQYKQIILSLRAKHIKQHKSNLKKDWKQTIKYKNTLMPRYFTINIYDINDDKYHLMYQPFYSTKDKTNFSKNLIKKGILKPLVF